MPKTATAPAESAWGGTLDEWNARSVHRAELPSGMRVEFRFPTLGDLIASGELPETLLEVAVEEWAAPGATADRALAEFANLPEQPTVEQQQAVEAAAKKAGEQLAAVNRHLCAAALIAPRVAPDDLLGLDLADLEMLSGILNRKIGFDAAGRRIGAELLEAAPFCDEHAGVADCAKCEEARERLSTTHR